MEAFGYSAYLANKWMKDVLCLWDADQGLPCAVLRKEQMEWLMSQGEVDAQASSAAMMQLNLKDPIPYDQMSYELWLESLKARKGMKAVAQKSNETMVAAGAIIIVLIILVLLLAL